MPETDLDLLIDAARAAGRIALGFSGPTAQSWDKPDLAGPVTEADLAVNEMLHHELRGARPDYGWLSEETEDADTRLGCERLFIVDPIDGTRSFIEGSGTWAHSLAVAEAGQVIAAAVYLPMRDKLYTASKDGGAFLNGTPIRVEQVRDLDDASVLAARPVMDPRHWTDGLVPPGLRRHYRPSLAYRLSLVAEGRFDAMLTLRDSWEWDIAAGELILREAGAVTSDRRGAPLRFNNPRPMVAGVIAAAPRLHGQIANRLLRTES